MKLFVIEILKQSRLKEILLAMTSLHKLHIFIGRSRFFSPDEEKDSEDTTLFSASTIEDKLRNKFSSEL